MVDFDKAFGLTRELYFSNHKKYYQSVVMGLGFEEVKKCIPFTLEQIKNAIANGDEPLNTLDMRKWDYESGITCTENRSFWNGSRITTLYTKHGIDCVSQAEGVCVLKACARMWSESEVI